ncbi:MAG: hypothetical protein KDA96_12760 [Planctomycetaceae bacterium]|nr:hypothetical protein [Planctomycetaceae bacterium]
MSIHFRSLICCLSAVMASLPAVAQDDFFYQPDQLSEPTRELTLLNPDETPAANARVAVYGKAAKAPLKVDSVFIEYPPTDGGNSPQFADARGRIQIERDPKAVIASTEQGFAFIPGESLQKSALLRPWASVKLETATLPEAFRDQFVILITWSNHLAGTYDPGPIRHATSKPLHNGFNTGFGDPMSTPNWRVDRMVTVRYELPVEDQVIQVPPGEVTVALLSKPNGVFDDSKQDAVTNASGVERPETRLNVDLGFWPVESEKTTTISLPQFGWVTGNLFESSAGTLPDWNRTSRVKHMIAAIPEKNVVYRSYQVPADLLSEAGVRYRNRMSGFVLGHVTDNNQILFPPIPVGKYHVQAMAQETAGTGPGGSPALIFHSQLVERADDQANGKQPAPIVIQVTAGNTNDVGNLVLTPNVLNRTPGDVLATPAFNASQSTSQPVLPAGPATSTANPYGSPSRPNSPIGIAGPPHLPQAQPAGISEPAPATIAPPTVYTSPAATSTDADSFATQMIEQWRRGAEPGADDAELRELLKSHLGSEFDSSVRTREEELQRLQTLLEKSREWLQKRKENREQIIEKKIDDLLKSSPPVDGGRPATTRRR